MKKIIGIIVLLLIIIGGVFGYKYYNETYVMHTEYAKVPAEVPAKTQTKTASGKTVANMFSYKYKMTFFNDKGEATVREIEIHDEQATPLQPNALVKIETNEKRNTSPQIVSENEIPKVVLEKLTQE